MKNLMLITISIFLFVSCTKKDEKEQLFYDYQSEVVKKTFNTDLKELDFKIKFNEEFENIHAKDSIKIIFAKIYNQMGLLSISPEFVPDSTTIEGLKKKNKETIQLYDELADLAFEAYDNYNYEIAEKESKKYTLAYSYAEVYTPIVEGYKKNPDEVLCYGFKVQYTIKNPALNNITQTFDKVFFTNKSQTKIVHVEDLE